MSAREIRRRRNRGWCTSDPGLGQKACVSYVHILTTSEQGHLATMYFLIKPRLRWCPSFRCTHQHVCHGTGRTCFWRDFFFWIHRARIRGQDRTQDALKMGCALPVGFHGDNKRHRLLACVSTKQCTRWPTPPSLTAPVTFSWICGPLCRSGRPPPSPLLLERCGRRHFSIERFLLRRPGVSFRG